MTDKHQKNNFFKILYKICKEKNIDFYNFHWSHGITNMKDEYKNIFKLFLSRGWIRHINEFIEYYEAQMKINKNLVIIHNCHEIPHCNLHNINIKRKKIYGGFIYLDRKNYELYDKSFLKKITEIKNQYKTTKGNIDNE